MPDGIMWWKSIELPIDTFAFVPRIKPKALHLLQEQSAAELLPQSCSFSYKPVLWFKCSLQRFMIKKLFPESCIHLIINGNFAGGDKATNSVENVFVIKNKNFFSCSVSRDALAASFQSSFSKKEIFNCCLFSFSSFKNCNNKL